MSTAPEPSAKRIGVLIVAYNAASTLHTVLDRIPPDFRSRISEVLVSDDASQDATYLVGLGYQSETDLPLTVIRQPENLGYGGNQKAGYEWAIERGLDIVVLLHGDGQYAPEMLPDIVAPLERDECDAVFGSRMIQAGAARRGGMPLYKYVGNRVLTTLENAVVGTSLSEWHSGYRAYSVAALKDIPFAANSDAFDFDTEIIIQLHEAGKVIHEVPIPTFYGDEICHVNGMGYALDITGDVVRYRLDKMGFGTGELAFASQAQQSAADTDPTAAKVGRWLSQRRPGRVLDLGGAHGRLGELLEMSGHTVVAVSGSEFEGAASHVEDVVVADLDDGVPAAITGTFDIVLATDVLDRTRRPDRLLAEAVERLSPGGVVVVSVPNFAHWRPRLRVLAGRFDYDRHGTLNANHLRLFTRASFERLVQRAGLRVRRREYVGRAGDPTAPAHRLDEIGTTIRPTLFATEFVYELERA